MGGRGLRKQIVEHNFPSLPKDFVEWARRTGVAEQVVRGNKDIVEALREWQSERRLLDE